MTPSRRRQKFTSHFVETSNQPKEVSSVSERTKALIAKRISLVSRNASKSAIRKIRKQIKRSSLQDYKDWVAKTVSDMESANKVGDTKKIFRLVNLSPANRKPLQKHSLKMTKATY